MQNETIVRPRMTATNRDRLSAMADVLSEDRQEGIALVLDLAERSGMYKMDCARAENWAESLSYNNETISKALDKSALDLHHMTKDREELRKAHAIAENGRLKALDEITSVSNFGYEKLSLAESFHKWYFIGGIASGALVSAILSHFYL